MQSYKELIVYQKGYKLALIIYQITKDYPREEIYGITSQMRRSAVSIPCNISEGYRRGHCKEYIQFLYMAHGSCSEFETLMSLSHDLGLISEQVFNEIYALQEEVSKLLNGLISSLSKSSRKN